MPTLRAQENWRPARASQRRAHIKTAVRTNDSIARIGLLSELRHKPGIELVDDAERADVAVVVTRRSLDGLVPHAKRLVVVADNLPQSELWTAIEHGLTVLLPRSEATTTRLLQAISDAHHGRGSLPAETLGRLLNGLSSLHEQVLAPRDITFSGLSRRETSVLRMLADGMETSEIAAKLSYSDRTVKYIIREILTRLGLQNRAHAVAHGIRHGLI